MLTAVRRRSRHLQAPIWLAWAALALRALTPDGYMPAAISEGNGPFALCPDGLPAALVARFGLHDHHAGHGPDHDRHHGDDAETGQGHPDRPDGASAGDTCDLGHALSVELMATTDFGVDPLPAARPASDDAAGPSVENRVPAPRSRGPPTV